MPFCLPSPHSVSPLNTVNKSQPMYLPLRGPILGNQFCDTIYQVYKKDMNQVAIKKCDSVTVAYAARGQRTVLQEYLPILGDREILSWGSVSLTEIIIAEIDWTLSACQALL